MKEFFTRAKPIWVKGLQKEKNLQVIFKTKVNLEEVKPTILIITGATQYRIIINGEFAGYGPARGPHGYVRVDELPITKLLHPGDNEITIEVAGYYCASFYTLRLPSFLQAEIIAEGEILAYTGNCFSAELQNMRIQKVMRYSWQRAFSEVWDMSKSNIEQPVEEVEVSLNYLKRNLKNPTYEINSEYQLMEMGDFIYQAPEQYHKDRYITMISETFDGFLEEELEAAPAYIWQSLVLNHQTGENPGEKSILKAGQYILMDLKKNYTGFLLMKLVANQNSHVMLSFDEKLVDGTIAHKNMDMINLLDYKLPQREEPWELESFEAYGLRYAMLYVLEGEVELQSFALRTYEYPMDILPYEGEDPKLKEIYDAAARTLCQNTLDTYMDCPTRERAGWLCDSYYTAQAEFGMTGKVEVEPIFMENYLLYPQGTIVPKGMLPMCYPGEHLNGEYIPQWAMWYILELEQYLLRDANAQGEDYRNLCYGLLDYFKDYENEDGLLEKLPSWNFIEWSAANDWAQDVNYPTNMLYARIEEIIATLYQDEELLKRAKRLKEIIIQEAFNGTLFIDHAVRDEQGNLIKQKDISEVCQYYAIRFLKIDLEEEKYEGLKKAVLEEFGPDRSKTGKWAEVEPANALMGIYLRMEILLLLEKTEKLRNEIKDYFGGMALKTSTLWEHKFMASSLNHGFAAFVGAVIRKIE